MSSYSYVAINPDGVETRGTLDVSNPIEAVRRIKQMGLYPTKVLEESERKRRGPRQGSRALQLPLGMFRGRVPAARLTTFTRQTATLIEAGMPLLRGLHILREQEENRALQAILGEISREIESGSSYADALARHPRVFNALYVNMVRAGEMGGALELTLKRLADFMEKARRIKGKIKAAMFYPCAVLAIAIAILVLLMVFIVPRFEQVYDGLLQGRELPAFTLVVMNISNGIQENFIACGLSVVALCCVFPLLLRSSAGRRLYDRAKLSLPGVGPVFRKVAISRFSRTLGTLAGSGVPILQALTIVKETAGNVVVGRVIDEVHARVKEGEPIAPTLKCSGVFPPMVAGMVDVGEQTGALPEMLMKVADTCDEEVDNAATAMTSLLEPIMIVFLAVVVGSIVIAMFLPLLHIMMEIDNPSAGPRED